MLLRVAQSRTQRSLKARMRVASNLRYALVACSIAIALVFGNPGRGISQSRADPTEEKMRSLTEDDYRILEVVLLDATSSRAFLLADPAGKKTKVVLDEKSAGSSDTFLLSDGQLHTDGHDRRPHIIAMDIRENLRRRNSGDAASLRGYTPSSPKVLVQDLMGLRVTESYWPREMYPAEKFREKYPDARGFLRTWLPGYSKDRKTAVLQAWFGPTPHGAWLTYMLEKKEDRWTVVWRTSVSHT
jgi:hypothetical protein